MTGRLIRRLAVVAAGLAVAASITVTPAVAAGGGTVQGRITDEHGNPTSAQIGLEPLDGSNNIPGASGDDGLFTVPDVPAGQYRFVISDSTHPPQWAPGQDSPEKAVPVTVTEGRISTVDERFLPLVRLVVRVTDAVTGRPVAGACASVGASPFPFACAGAGGVATVDGAWPGPANVDVSDPNGAHWPATVENVGFTRGAVTRISVVLRPAASITATVRDASTRQPVLACVSVALREGHGIFGGGRGCYTTDAAGKLVIGPLDPTTGQLFVEPLDTAHGKLWVTTTGGTGDQRKARMITAAVGHPVQLPPIEVGPAGTISGTVRNRATGAPIGTVCAYAFAFDPRLGNDPSRRCSTSTGAYTISGLGPYSWPVLFTSAPVFGLAWQWSGDVADRFSARMVRVRAGGTTTLDARMYPGGTVSGAVVDGAGSPVFASVNAYNARTGDFAADSTTSAPSEGQPFVVRGLATQQVKIEYSVTGSCWYLNKGSFAAATRLPVAAGADVGPLTLVDCTP